MRLLIVGGNLLGIAFAKRMMGSGTQISIIENRPQKIQDIESALDEYEDVQIFAGDAASYTVLKEAGAGYTDMAAVFAGKDILNSLIAQKLHKLFEVEKVMTIVESAHYKSILESEGITAVSILDTVADSMIAALDGEDPATRTGDNKQAQSKGSRKKTGAQKIDSVKTQTSDAKPDPAEIGADEIEYINANDELSTDILESDPIGGNESEEL